MMSDGDESCREVEEDECDEMTTVWGEKVVIGGFGEACFCAVLCAETGLKRLEQVIGDEVGFELGGDNTLQ